MSREKNYKTAVCGVLNKIYWKIPKCDPNNIAVEASEYLDLLGYGFIEWDEKHEVFRVRIP